jgi:hypothetical protein
MIVQIGIAVCCFVLAIKCFMERADRVKLVFSILFLFVGIAVLLI